MKIPEQLPLDFSTPPNELAEPVLPDASRIVDLQAVRLARTDQRIASAYEAIRASIRHIDVRRGSPTR